MPAALAHGARSLSDPSKTHRFEQLMLPHLDAAFNLARWLTRNPSDAEDVVQEAYLRAFKFFDSFHGGNSRAWLLTIVRNTCLSWLHANRPGEVTALADLVPDDAAEAGWVDAHALAGAAPDDPEQLLLQAEARKCLNDLIE